MCSLAMLDDCVWVCECVWSQCWFCPSFLVVFVLWCVMLHLHVYQPHLTECMCVMVCVLLSKSLSVRESFSVCAVLCVYDHVGVE